MKIISQLLLVFFLLFLSKPILVSLIEKNTTISCEIDSKSEEGKEKSEVLKTDFIFTTSLVLVEIFIKNSAKIISQNSSIHRTILDEIFIPPPEFA